MPSCMTRPNSSSDQPPIPVATSGVMFGPINAPKGVSSAAPPANGLPSGAVWQETQSPTTARYRPRSIFSNDWLSSPATAAIVSVAQSTSTRIVRLRILMPIPHRCGLSGLHERAGTLQVPVYDRVRRPIGERAYRVGRIIPGVLWEGGGTHDEQVGYVPTLQIAVQRAGLGIGAHDRTTAGVRRLVHRNVIGARARLLIELPRPHLLHDLRQTVGQVLRHLEFIFVEIERDPHELAAEPVGVRRIEVQVGVAVTAAAAVGDDFVTAQIVLRHRLLPVETPSRSSLRCPRALDRPAVGLHRAHIAAADEAVRPMIEIVAVELIDAHPDRTGCD